MSVVTRNDKTASVTAVVTKKSERHEVSVELEVTDSPVLAGKDALPSMRPLTPETVVLRYMRTGATWSVHVTIYGTPTTGSPLLRAWSNFAYSPDRPESLSEWPAWLRGIATQHHPATEILAAASEAKS